MFVRMFLGGGAHQTLGNRGMIIPDAVANVSLWNMYVRKVRSIERHTEQQKSEAPKLDLYAVRFWLFGVPLIFVRAYFAYIRLNPLGLGLLPSSWDKSVLQYSIIY